MTGFLPVIRSYQQLAVRILFVPRGCQAIQVTTAHNINEDERSLCTVVACKLFKHLVGRLKLEVV